MFIITTFNKGYAVQLTAHCTLDTAPRSTAQHCTLQITQIFWRYVLGIPRHNWKYIAHSVLEFTAVLSDQYISGVSNPSVLWCNKRGGLENIWTQSKLATQLYYIFIWVRGENYEVKRFDHQAQSIISGLSPIKKYTKNHNFQLNQKFRQNRTDLMYLWIN